MEDHGIHVVFGASGSIGRAVIRELLSRGRKVRAVNRRGVKLFHDNVEVFKADATNKEHTVAACKGASVVYHCAGADYTKWGQQLPLLMKGIMDGAVSAKAKLVYADNLYMYGPVDGLITETLPNAATTKKGRIRANLAETLMMANKIGKVRAVIGRGSDFYGPGAFNGSGNFIFRPAVNGKRISILGNVEMPHTWTYTPDFARGLATLGERDEALGEIWHVPSAPTLTLKDFIYMIYKELDAKPQILAPPRAMVGLLAVFNPMMNELKEMLYQWEEPFIMDHSKFERAFGNPSTSHEEAIHRTVHWFKKLKTK